MFHIDSYIHTDTSKKKHTQKKYQRDIRLTLAINNEGHCVHGMYTVKVK